jgi:catechol 2,3-dioxygenase-like lactoylglutathione lyase family enzyme
VAAAAVAAVRKFGHADHEPAEAGKAAAGKGEAGKTEAGKAEANPWAAPPPVSVEADEHADELITAYPSARPGPAGAIYGVGITVLVTDLARSVAFYRDTLGFYEIDRGDGSAVLASGDTRLVLRTVAGLSAEAGRLIFLNLEVGDVEAVYAELVEKGVRFVHPPQPVNRGDRLELWSATFLDPDDHNIAITQWRAIR